ncbi:MAG: DUF3618 domain-containing protein [Rhizobiales bacterium]|nr:DUF3618 domain-containing protein [Hyphomicrobiales bacterium]
MKESITARDVEHEAHARRERLASTLDELSASLTPGRILDEVLSYAKGGGGNFLMGLGKSAAANPLPTLLITTGCAMYLSGKGGLDFIGAKRSPREYSEPQNEFSRSVRGRTHNDGPGLAARAANSISDAASAVGDMVGGAASGVATSASGAGARVAETAKGMANQASEYVSAAGETARDFADGASQMTRDTAASAQRKATLLGRELHGRTAALFEDYPLVVAAGGVIVGAAVAALLPRTRMENEFMGKSSDTLKDAFLAEASDKAERVATGIENVYDRVVAQAGEEDLVGAAKGSIEELADKVGRTFQAAKDAVNDELSSAEAR